MNMIPNIAIVKDINLKDLISNLNVGIFRCSIGHKGQFLFVNPALANLLGFKMDELLKTSAQEIFADPRIYRYLHDKIDRERHVYDVEVQLKRKDKKIVRCAINATAVKDKRGITKWIDGIIKDGTFQKHSEKDLIESKELFRTVFDNSAVAIMVTDKDERMVAWNPSTEKMLEMTKQDLFNKSVKDLYPPHEWNKIRAFRSKRKGMLSDIETQIYKRDGTLLDVIVSMSVLKDNQGNVIGTIDIVNDITKQKMAERRIKESENKIRVILDNSAAAITLIDEQERIVSWNNYTIQLLGKTKKDLYLKHVSMLYPEEEWLKIRAANIRQTGSKHHLETKVVRKDGKIIDVDLSINVLKDSNNKIIGSVGIMQDITEQKRVKEALLQAKLVAEEANNSKSLFLANMSHEVRTPMSTVLGMIDLTLDTDLNEEQRENLKTAKDAAENLLGLLNDILDLSRVESGKMRLETIEFNLPNVIKSICKALSVLAQNKNLELKLNIDHNVPELLLGDPVRIRQILVNLINNAIKFTHKGYIETKVKAASVSEKNCELIFSVTDTGIGIPEDKHDLIFEVFTQADDSTTRRYGGTGLGLAICKRLVEMMGGHIWVKSKEGEGSTFSFTCSFKIAEKKAVRVTTPEDQQALEAGQKLTEELFILLAEDNLVNQKITVKLLEKRGWKVETVENGKDVLDRIGQKSYDVILMDTHMPILDGLETTKIIREDEKKTGQHIPIIALTARVMEEDRQRCLKSGMDEYLPKPIDRKKMYEVIENITKNNNQRKSS